jgi:hypothetical protein
LIFDNERFWDDFHCIEFSIFFKTA